MTLRRGLPQGEGTGVPWQQAAGDKKIQGLWTEKGGPLSALEPGAGEATKNLLGVPLPVLLVSSWEFSLTQVLVG